MLNISPYPVGKETKHMHVIILWYNICCSKKKKNIWRTCYGALIYIYIYAI